MLLIADERGCIYPATVRWRDRLIARFHPGPLDEALATGISPDASVVIALRARALTNMRSRQTLSRALQRAVGIAAGPARRQPLTVVLNRRGIAAAASDIEELSSRLLDAGPVSARGVALVNILVTCGVGPLHNRRSSEQLISSVRRAIDCLRPTSRVA
jgi:hypothetical protein